MGWQPKIVAHAQTPCWPWDLRDGGDVRPKGGQCANCGRDIAVPPDLNGYQTICLYCALENGILPLEEIEPDDERSPHDIAMAERAAQGMSASGHDPQGLEAKPASPVAESDAPQTPPENHNGQ